ncbi:alpha/beta-hydrolase [Fomitopsis serialis]|uniref:alpha/beta-hydrolase n=1 Tax=Fomitopsis serialis TaxID=139415 RepID=UPI002007E092|nr:alpha/beta-hydrolase [Neoantrodia serialis]KAH9938464.1 alpha/beta-hydrolase [Neoantrodia serialis]
MAATTSGTPPGVLPLPPARDIPSTFVASMKSWWHAGEKESAAAEERLLRKLPFFRPAGSPPPTPDGTYQVVAESKRVELNNPKHYINTLTMTPTSRQLVLLHGYGAGLGFFFQNFLALGQWASRRGTSVFALDWLGMGRSARVPFSIKAKRDDIDGRVNEAEGFFIDSLEQWRERMGLERMTLVGHSLGGYLSIILLSPAGVPRDPESTVYAREVTDEQTTGQLERIKTGQEEVQKKESRSRRLLTPFQVIRSSMFWGPMLVGKYSSRRFIGLSQDEPGRCTTTCEPRTCEGIGRVLRLTPARSGAHARRPLVDRIHALAMPITFVYGEHDWMDPEGGSEAIERLRQAGNGDGKMYIIPHAGHHVYLDNPKAVNDLLVKELDRPLKA